MDSQIQIPKMHDYQIYAKEFIKTHPRCGLFLDMGLGKAVDDETKIPTPTGLKKVGDIQVGDKIFSMDGNITTVEAVYKHINKTAYSVKLEDKRSFVCCDEHLIPLHKKGIGVNDVKPLKNLIKDYKENNNGKITYKYAIPWNKPVQYKGHQEKFPVEAFGIAITHGKWINNQLEFSDETPNTAKIIFNRINQEQINKLLEELKNNVDVNGVFNKIPDWCINLCPLEKSKLIMSLAGLDYESMITGEYPKTLEIKLPNEEMAKQVQQLSWSMGHACEYKWRPRKKIAEISIQFSRKETSDRGLKIIEITQVSNRNMTCFTVSDKTHTYLINDYIVTHNTLVTLMALWEIAPPGHILVIAPKTIAKATWTDEIKKWNIPVRTKSFVINEKGKELSKKKRLEMYQNLLNEPPSMYFINREKFTDLVANLPEKNGVKICPFHTIIVDELQSFKNYTSNRTKALIKLAPYCQRFIGLTGTPTPQGLMDLWSEIHFMDGGRRLGKNITQYRNRWFIPTMYINNHPVGWEPLPNAENEIYSLINDLVISIKNPNIKLPPVTFNNINITLDADEMKLYKKFAKESAMILDDGRTVTAANAGQLRLKLTQMASGSIYIEKGKHEYKIIHEKKLDICEYIINNTSGNIIIAYQFKSDLDMLLKRFPNASVFKGDLDMMDEWNKKKIPIMLLNPASAGHGLNLQYGGHTLIWYTTPTNLEFYLQCNKRLARQGQTEPVTIHHLLVEKTVDIQNLKLIEMKNTNEERLIEAVQETIDFAIS